MTQWVEYTPLILISLAALLCVPLFVFWLTERRAIAAVQSLQARLHARNRLLRTVFQPLTTIFFLLGIAVTWFQVQTTLKTAGDQMRLADAGQASEAYRNALSGLSSEDTTVQAGAIYALKAIARAHPREYLDTVDEVLSVFVRNRCSLAYHDLYVRRHQLWPPDGVRAGLSVLSDLSALSEQDASNRMQHYKSRPNVRGIFLADGDLRGAKLTGLDLKEAHFERAKLDEAQVSGSDLTGAHLAGAQLVRTDLRGAVLENAEFSNAKMDFVSLASSNLVGAWLDHAHLTAADLRKANLASAHFDHASVTACNWSGAELYDTDGLDTTSGMALGDLRDTFGNATTALPDTIPRPSSWLLP